MASEPDTAEARRLLDAAHKMVVALCQPRNSPGAREWMMSIPARRDYDPDLVIGDAIEAGRSLADALDAAREREGEVTEALKQVLYKITAARKDVDAADVPTHYLPRLSYYDVERWWAVMRNITIAELRKNVAKIKAAWARESTDD